MAGKGGARKDDTGMLFRMLEDKVELERKFGVEVIPAASPEKGLDLTAEDASRWIGTKTEGAEEEQGVQKGLRSKAEGRGNGLPLTLTRLRQGYGGQALPLKGGGMIRNPNDDSIPNAETQIAGGMPPPLAVAETAKEPTTRSEGSGTKAERLAALEREMAECHECLLGATRTKLVFGVGSAEAELMFVGEAPGADEDAQGIPFVGRAGQLLTKIIEGMKVKRSDVYIANILKCRPPENRAPRPTEVACCLPYLRRQIEIIHPKIMVCLGGVAAKTLLQTDMPVGRMRGTFLEYDGIPLLVTFHPAYLLRNPADKNLVWEDMKMVLHRLGRPIPKQS
jgi:DNA polymerase